MKNKWKTREKPTSTISFPSLDSGFLNFYMVLALEMQGIKV